MAALEVEYVNLHYLPDGKITICQYVWY